VALILPAYAKLNLTLDVVGRRPNGYHDIDSVMQTVSLHDLLWMERTDCRVFEVVGPPIEGENLVLKAARELEGRLSRALPFTIRLFKRIPMGAGLGGGSADAATFLKAANQLYDLGLKQAQLVEIATEVGQDVPFFLRGGTARATGLGSTVSPLPPVPDSWRILVVYPPVQVATRTVYQAVDGSFVSARRTPELIEALTLSPTLPTRGREILDPPGGREILDPPGGREIPPPRPSPQGGGRASGKGEMAYQGFGNDLEPVTRKLFPAMEEAVSRLRTAVPSLTMTGTGAALFAVFPTRREAEAALAAARPIGYPAWVCRPIPAGA
jgi:4-diphosphocytidyl-2-C-methyl-D-erythritol kinase